MAPLKKPDISLACVDTALADDKLMVAEAELLRTIGMAIDWPMPPTLLNSGMKSETPYS